MRVQTKLLLLLLFLVAVLITGILLYQVSEESRENQLMHTAEKDKAIVLDRILQLKGASLEQLVRDNSLGEEVVAANNNRDPAQVQRKLTIALETHQGTVLWVLDQSYKPIYSVTKNGVSLQTQFSDDPSVRRMLDRDHICHFYLDNPAGIFEIWGASIHPPLDHEHTQQPLGYLFAARPLNQEFLGEIASLTESTIELQRGSSGDHVLGRSVRSLGYVNFSKVLQQPDGRQIGRIVGKVDSRVIRESRRISNVLFILLAGFAIVTLLIMTVLLNRWVRNPLYQLSAALDSGDVGLMSNLTHTDGEFGDLARLIDQFFTQKKAIESRQRELVETNRLLGQAIEEAKRLAREAEVATITKSEILANVSHEIRTPLNAIVGVSDLMLDSNPTNEQREYTETIRNSAQSLLEMIGELLDFSRIEAGKLDLAQMEFGLRDSVAETLAMVAMRAHTKGLELCYRVLKDVPDNLLGDVRRLRQVILNLVDNAIKFTNQGEIVVEVGLVEALDQKLLLQFSVRDTGIGIPPEKHQVIFEPFTQVDSSATRRYRGAGLGLAISSRLIKMMGGRIWLESQVGSGTTFRFTVRLQTQARPSRFTSEVPNLRGVRVLLLDDNAVSRAIITEVLESWGLEVFSAESGRIAAAAIDQSIQTGKTFNVVVADAGLNDASPTDLARQLAVTKGYETVGLLFLASTNELVGQSTAYQVEHATWLLKPPKMKRLQEALLSAIALNSQREIRTMVPDEKPTSTDVPPATDAPTPCPIDAKATVPKIDEAAFMVRAGGDPQLAAELIDLLFQQLPLLRADVDKALANRDVRALSRAAHTLKGSVGNFGARAAMELAKKLELSIPESGDFEQAAALRSQLEQELSLLEVDLKALRDRLASTG
jgi:signal transduction histidine kinase/HPt (histidine-containing phosphotransfer) domain-containing protein/FixJ family two-component response regulator